MRREIEKKNREERRSEERKEEMKEEVIVLKNVPKPKTRQTNYLTMILKNPRRTDYLFESSESDPCFQLCT